MSRSSSASGLFRWVFVCEVENDDIYFETLYTDVWNSGFEFDEPSHRPDSDWLKEAFGEFSHKQKDVIELLPDMAWEEGKLYEVIGEIDVVGYVYYGESSEWKEDVTLDNLIVTVLPNESMSYFVDEDNVA